MGPMKSKIKNSKKGELLLLPLLQSKNEWLLQTGPKNRPKGLPKNRDTEGAGTSRITKILNSNVNLSNQDLQRLWFNRKKCFWRQWTLLKCSIDQVMFCFADGYISYLWTLCPKMFTIILQNSISTNKIVILLWASLIEDGFSICSYSKPPRQDSKRFILCCLFEIFNNNSFEQLCFYIRLCQSNNQ